MFWFVRYRFPYSAHDMEPGERLAKTLQQEEWQRISYRIGRERVRLQHKLPVFFFNYWNPIFVGRFVSSGDRRYLVGYFRAHWLVFVANLLAMSVAAYQVASSLLDSSGEAGEVEFWLRPELYGEASLLAALVLLMIFGWLIGVPYERRILALIRESASDKPDKAHAVTKHALFET